MSSKQLVSPRKPKKRPYRRRIRNKKNNHNHNDNNNNKLTNISTNDKLKPMKLHSNDSNPNNIPLIAHSRTLSYVNNNHNKSNTNRNNNNNNNSHSRVNSPLSPIQIENELLTSPRTNNNNNNNIKANNNNNFLSFNTCNSQKLS
eukprot:480250_1